MVRKKFIVEVDSEFADEFYGEYVLNALENHNYYPYLEPLKFTVKKYNPKPSCKFVECTFCEYWNNPGCTKREYIFCGCKKGKKKAKSKSSLGYPYFT